MEKRVIFESIKGKRGILKIKFSGNKIHFRKALKEYCERHKDDLRRIKFLRERRKVFA